MVEALRNICGATLLKDGYEDYEEFNLKKFQLIHTANSAQSNLTNYKSQGKEKSAESSYYEHSNSSKDDRGPLIEEDGEPDEVETTDLIDYNEE